MINKLKNKFRYWINDLINENTLQLRRDVWSLKNEVSHLHKGLDERMFTPSNKKTNTVRRLTFKGIGIEDLKTAIERTLGLYNRYDKYASVSFGTGLDEIIDLWVELKDENDHEYFRELIVSFIRLMGGRNG